MNRPNDREIRDAAPYYARQLGLVGDGRPREVKPSTLHSLRRRGLVDARGRLTTEGQRTLNIALEAIGGAPTGEDDR